MTSAIADSRSMASSDRCSTSDIECSAYNSSELGEAKDNWWGNSGKGEEHPYYTRALPLWNLLREPKKLIMVEGAGHLPPLEARVPAINDWLDETLGPVERRP